MLTVVALEAHCRGGRKPMLAFDGGRRRQVGDGDWHTQKEEGGGGLTCLLAGGLI